MMSLQDKLDRFPTAIEALTVQLPPAYHFPYPAEHTNWRDETRAWGETAVLFNQSWHMTDLYLSGPDALRLLSDTSVNSYRGFGRDRAKQYLAVNEEGQTVGDAILFGLEDDLFAVVGFELPINWLQYQAQAGGYDVQFDRDAAGWGRIGPVPKRFYRYELEGPNAWRILETAAGRTLDPIGFFRMGEIDLGGLKVRALNHTMGGVPGQQSTGRELFGPADEADEFLERILAAGAEHGLVRGGARSYGTASLESGWIGGVVPAIYTSDALRPYRQWLPDTAFENVVPATSGSFRPTEIDGYYLNPWDLGYGHMIKLDHDFIGRAALEALADEPHGRKAWLVWNDDDATGVLADAMFDRSPRPRDLWAPFHQVRDSVVHNGQTVGLTHQTGYTVGLGGWTSLATVDERIAVDGAEVQILWGDYDGGASDPYAPDHEARLVRATVHLTSPAL
jgi:glycine cleavage system aminomethyltransferase T